MKKMRWILLSWLFVATACTLENITNVKVPPDKGTPADTTSKPDTTTTSTSAKWVRGFSPADTTINPTVRFRAGGALAVIPTGKSSGVTVVGSRGCITNNTKPVVEHYRADTFAVSIPEVIGIATCASRDSLGVRLDADTTQVAYIVALVVSAGGPTNVDTLSVTQTPNTGSGQKGTYMQSDCTVKTPAWLTDRRCWSYSTDPSRVLTIQKDTTFASTVGPWPQGFHKMGEIYFLNVGWAKICKFLVVNPTIADCGIYTTLGSSGVAALSGEWVLPIRHYEVPEFMKDLSRLR